jgi:hypothetical protein
VAPTVCAGITEIEYQKVMQMKASDAYGAILAVVIGVVLAAALWHWWST